MITVKQLADSGLLSNFNDVYLNFPENVPNRWCLLHTLPKGFTGVIIKVTNDQDLMNIYAESTISKLTVDDDGDAIIRLKEIIENEEEIKNYEIKGTSELGIGLSFN